MNIKLTVGDKFDAWVQEIAAEYNMTDKQVYRALLVLGRVRYFKQGTTDEQLQVCSTHNGEVEFRQRLATSEWTKAMR